MPGLDTASPVKGRIQETSQAVWILFDNVRLVCICMPGEYSNLFGGDLASRWYADFSLMGLWPEGPHRQRSKENPRNAVRSVAAGKSSLGKAIWPGSMLDSEFCTLSQELGLAPANLLRVLVQLR